MCDIGSVLKRAGYPETKIQYILKHLFTGKNKMNVICVFMKSNRFFIKFLCLSFYFATSSSANILLRDHVNFSGPALYIGVGTQCGLIGGKAEYQFKVAKSFVTIAPFVGIGQYEVGDKPFLGYMAGGGIEIGKAHRGFLVLGYGSIASEKTTTYSYDGIILNKTYSNQKLVYGPAFEVGYKGMAKFGLTWFGGFGYGYPVNTTEDSNKTMSLVLSGGVGYKL